ncbi:NAD(P)/FAD-dependent oxidoreductase [Hymenobacter lapidiphilus]|uniref:NAD(P)/FAD-dependent oxidoreductase n=1 Tax=Hymenobacter sp. CCM 8763 TaxID=2303334 RepID=UPI000E356776|nr:NAD(P)/FAD-dependent oxidoreductase [Hymenobacter sp. CCM 8763]RFP64312.1 NAD(P)/FAD-dependent oxidoreductase [Hymenobacter sp. CCM 8763]
MAASEIDFIIVGGSYAGLSAALALGRARCRVLVLDAGQPRNRTTPHAHNLLLHDGDAPAELAARARQQVAAYPTVQLLEARATAAEKLPDGTLQVTTAAHGTFAAPTLLLATGLRDELPPLPGFAECWSTSIVHCPYCHGYEVADQPTGLWMNGEMVAHMVAMLLNWTRELTVFTNGPATFGADVRALLAQHSVSLEETPVAALLHTGPQLDGLGLADGRALPLRVLYAKVPWQQGCDLPAQLGCELDELGLLRVDELNQTTVPGVYALGDNCTMMHQLANAIGVGNRVGGLLSRDLILGRTLPMRP